MSKENVESVLAAIEAFARRDLAGFLRYADPEIEFEPQLAALEGAYTGHAGVTRFFVDAWENLEVVGVTYSDVRDLGDRVLALGAFQIGGQGSGVMAEAPFAIVNTFRDGRIIRTKDYAEHALALEAVGLRE